MRIQDLPPYTYEVFKDEPSGEYVAVCEEIPGLSGVSETEAGAIDELKEAIAGWLEVLEEQGLSFPPPQRHLQGKVVVPQVFDVKGGIFSAAGVVSCNTTAGISTTLQEYAYA